MPSTPCPRSRPAAQPAQAQPEQAAGAVACERARAKPRHRIQLQQQLNPKWGLERLCDLLLRWRETHLAEVGRLRPRCDIGRRNHSSLLGWETGLGEERRPCYAIEATSSYLFAEITAGAWRSPLVPASSFAISPLTSYRADRPSAFLRHRSSQAQRTLRMLRHCIALGASEPLCPDARRHSSKSTSAPTNHCVRS